MNKSISQKKAEEVRNRHLARQFPHVGRIIAERDAYAAALTAAGLPLLVVADKKPGKSGPPVAKKVVAEVVPPAPSLAVEPDGTPLPTEPEPVDESDAGDWGDPEPAPAAPEPAPKPEKPSRSRK